MKYYIDMTGALQNNGFWLLHGVFVVPDTTALLRNMGLLVIIEGPTVLGRPAAVQRAEVAVQYLQGL